MQLGASGCLGGPGVGAGLTLQHPQPYSLWGLPVFSLYTLPRPATSANVTDVSEAGKTQRSFPRGASPGPAERLLQAVGHRVSLRGRGKGLPSMSPSGRKASGGMRGGVRNRTYLKVALPEARGCPGPGTLLLISFCQAPASKQEQAWVSGPGVDASRPGPRTSAGQAGEEGTF